MEHPDQSSPQDSFLYIQTQSQPIVYIEIQTKNPPSPSPEIIVTFLMEINPRDNEICGGPFVAPTIAPPIPNSQFLIYFHVHFHFPISQHTHKQMTPPQPARLPKFSSSETYESSSFTSQHTHHTSLLTFLLDLPLPTFLNHRCCLRRGGNLQFAILPVFLLPSHASAI